MKEMKKSLRVVTLSLLVLGILGGCGKGKEPIEAKAVGNSSDIIEEYVDKSDYSAIDDIKNSDEWNNQKEFFKSDEVKQSKEKVKPLSEIKTDDTEVPLRSLVGEYNGNDNIKQMTVTLLEQTISFDDEPKAETVINVNISGINGNEYTLTNDYILSDEIKKEYSSDKFTNTFDNNQGLWLFLNNETIDEPVAYLKVKDGEIEIQHNEESSFVGIHGTSILSKKEITEESSKMTSLAELFGENKLNIGAGFITLEQNEKASLGYYFVGLEDNDLAEAKTYQYANVLAYKIYPEDNYATFVFNVNGKATILKVYKAENDSYVVNIAVNGESQTLGVNGSVMKDKYDKYYFENGYNVGDEIETEISDTEEVSEIEEFKNLKNDESEVQVTIDNKIDYLSEGIFHTNVLVSAKGMYEELDRDGDKFSLLYYSPDATIPFFYADNSRGEMDDSKAEATMPSDIGSNLKIDSSKYDKFYTFYLNLGSGETNYYLVTEKDGEILITLNTVKDEVTEENRIEKSILALKPVHAKKGMEAKDSSLMLSDFNNENTSYIAVLDNYYDDDATKHSFIHKIFITLSDDNKTMYLNRNVFEDAFQPAQQYLFAIAMFDYFFVGK